MLRELFACETKNADRGYAGAQKQVGYDSPSTVNAGEFAAQWEQSQVHNIDTNACTGCETTAGDQ